MMTEMLKLGMNVARFNFSHGSHASQYLNLQTLLKARNSINHNCAVLLDTQGPEIRTGIFEDPNYKCKIKENSLIKI